MAIKLQSLYEAINNQFDVILHTNSFYDKEVTWIHTVEQGEFSHLLHGDELIFNSGLNFTSQDWLKEFLKSLKDAHASGLIISVKSRPAFSQEIIDYCNEIQLPLFSTSWDTPFIDIMRIFSEILLKNEHRETSLAAALKNAIYYPENEDSYLNPLESNGFFRDMNYTILMISCHTYYSDSGNSYLEQLEKKIRYFMSKGIVYEEGKHLIVLFAGESVNDISQKLYDVCQNNSDVYVGIGTTVSQLTDIHRSYETAFSAYPLTNLHIGGVTAVLHSLRQCLQAMAGMLPAVLYYTARHIAAGTVKAAVHRHGAGLQCSGGGNDLKDRARLVGLVHCLVAPLDLLLVGKGLLVFVAVFLVLCQLLQRNLRNDCLRIIGVIVRHGGHSQYCAGIHVLHDDRRAVLYGMLGQCGGKVFFYHRLDIGIQRQYQAVAVLGAGDILIGVGHIGAPCVFGGQDAPVLPGQFVVVAQLQPPQARVVHIGKA